MSELHSARVCLLNALNDEWSELALQDRERAKLTDEISFAHYFLEEACKRLKDCHERVY